MIGSKKSKVAASVSVVVDFVFRVVVFVLSVAVVHYILVFEHR